MECGRCKVQQAQAWRCKEDSAESGVCSHQPLHFMATAVPAYPSWLENQPPPPP